MNELALLKALADPTRLAVMRLLAKRECTVSALQSLVGREQSLLSHHLKLLREAGLVHSRYRGAHVVYSLAHPRLAALVREVGATARAVEGTCKCVECGGPLLRPYPVEAKAGEPRLSGGARAE